MEVRYIIQIVRKLFSVPNSERCSLNSSSLMDKFSLESDKVRYYFAKKWIKGNNILNIACGEGYGSHILAGEKRIVYGLDYSKEAIVLAKRNFSSKNVRFQLANAYKIPFKNNFFSSIVSMETYEHMNNPDLFLRELKRVLKKFGTLVISFPNRVAEDKIFFNKFHVNPLSSSKMINLLRKYFRKVELYYQCPFIKKPFFMPYLTLPYSFLFYSKKIEKKRRRFITGFTYIIVCKK